MLNINKNKQDLGIFNNFQRFILDGITIKRQRRQLIKIKSVSEANN